MSRLRDRHVRMPLLLQVVVVEERRRAKASWQRHATEKGCATKQRDK